MQESKHTSSVLIDIFFLIIKKKNIGGFHSVDLPTSRVLRLRFLGTHRTAVLSYLDDGPRPGSNSGQVVAGAQNTKRRLIRHPYRSPVENRYNRLANLSFFYIGNILRMLN